MTRRDYIATILLEHGESFADVEYIDPVDIDLEAKGYYVLDATLWTKGKIYKFRTVHSNKPRDDSYIDINVVSRNPPDCG